MGSHPQPRTARATIEPGDTLVLYTDGMVDGTRDIIEGLAVLRSSATALRARDIDGWARGLLQAVLPADVASGDATLLAVRLNGQSASVRQTSTTR
jgi:serine phosphatase RsbU (regulator of sigma subunit)